jgi:hypothetical protein
VEQKQGAAGGGLNRNHKHRKSGEAARISRKKMQPSDFFLSLSKFFTIAQKYLKNKFYHEKNIKHVCHVRYSSVLHRRLHGRRRKRPHPNR